MGVGCGGSPTGGGGVVFSLSEVSAEINIIRWKLAEAWKKGGGGGGRYTANVNGGQPGGGGDRRLVPRLHTCVLLMQK